MIDRQVEVFEGEGHALRLGHFGDARKRIPRLEPHCPGDQLTGHLRQARIAQPGTVQVQPLNAQPLADLRGLACRAQKLIRAGIVGQPPGQIAVQDGIARTHPFELAQIVVRPVPEPDAEAHLGQPRGAPVHRPVTPQHLGAGGKLEG